MRKIQGHTESDDELSLHLYCFFMNISAYYYKPMSLKEEKFTSCLHIYHRAVESATAEINVALTFRNRPFRGTLL